MRLLSPSLIVLASFVSLVTAGCENNTSQESTPQSDTAPISEQSVEPSPQSYNPMQELSKNNKKVEGAVRIVIDQKVQEERLAKERSPVPPSEN